MKVNSTTMNFAPRTIRSSEFITFEIVAVLAFAGNLLVCIFFVRKKFLLKKTYNVYFLILALTDLFISTTLAVTPVFILSDILPFSLSVSTAETICRVMWSRWLLYILGIFSVYLCLLLTSERWFAVVKPMNYQGNFNKRKVVYSVVCAAMLPLVFSLSTPLEITHNRDSFGASRCSWKPMSGVFHQLWGVVRFLAECFVPSLIMIGLSIHVILKTHRSVAPIFNVSGRKLSSVGRSCQTQKAVIKMMGTASFFIILCWMPNQILLLLSKFGCVRLDSTLHRYLEVLTFFNTCINPVIYGITSKTFRKGYWELILGFCPPKIRVRLAQTRGGIAENIGSVVFLVHTIHRRKSYDWRFEGISPAKSTNTSPSVLSTSNL